MTFRLAPFAALACLPCSLPLFAQSTSEPATLGTVTVTAPAYNAERERQNTSSAKIIISREDLEKLDAATIGEILRQLPGVSLAGDTEGRRGRSRAADRLEPRIVVDGEALPGGNRMAMRLPAELIERIEIIRNSTAEFPSGAGGTINLILRDVPPRKTGSFRVGILNAGDAWGARVGGVYGAREGETGLLWMGFANSRPLVGDRSVSTEHYSAGVRDDWDIETDTEHGRETYLHLAPRVTRDLGAGTRLTLSPLLMVHDRDRVTDTVRQTYANPQSGAGLSADGSEREHEQTRRLNGRLAAEWKRRQPGKGETQARLSLQGDSERRTNDVVRTDATGTVTDTRTATRSAGVELGFTAKRSLPLGDAHLATFGTEARQKWVDETRRRSVNGTPTALGAQAGADTTERLVALWAQDEWQITETHLLTPGLRLQATNSAVTDALDATVSDSHLAWLPSVHYLWQISPSWNVRSSLALGEKPPGVRDLSPVIITASGTNSLSNPDRAGTPGLAAETSTSLQFGVEHFLPAKRGSAGLNLTLRQIDDRIQRQTQLESGRYVERPVNAGSAREATLVADFKTRLASLPTLTLRGNASTTRLSVDDVGGGQSESPRHAGNLGFDYEVPAAKLSVGGNLSLSARFSREPNSTVTLTHRARHQLDLYAVKKLDRTLSLRLTIDNVTRANQGFDTVDQSGGSVTSRETDSARGVRTVFLSLEGKL